MPMNAMEILEILIAYQGLTFAVYILFFQRGEKHRSHNILALLSLTFALHFASMLIVERRLFGILPNINPLCGILYLPLIYFYTKSLIYQKFSGMSKDVLRHFLYNLPLIVYAIFWIVDDYQNQVNGILQNSLVTVPILLQMTVYLVTIFFEIKGFRQVLKNTRAEYDAINLSWIKSVLIYFIIIMSLIGIEYLFHWTDAQEYIALLIFASILWGLNSFFFRGLQHVTVFDGIDESDRMLGTSKPTGQEDLDLQSEVVLHDIDRLQVLMRENKPYCDPEINLDALAELLGVAPRYLSSLLNQHLHQNFFEFINTYRIEEAKRLLNARHQSRSSIKEVMYEVGYNSKSTFNHTFKKHTGITPSEFRRTR